MRRANYSIRSVGHSAVRLAAWLNGLCVRAANLGQFAKSPTLAAVLSSRRSFLSAAVGQAKIKATPKAAHAIAVAVAVRPVARPH